MQKKRNEAKEKPTDMCSQDASCSCFVILVLVVVVVAACWLACMRVRMWDKYGTQGCPRHEQKQTFQLASVCRAPFVYKFNLSKAKTLTAQLNIFLTLRVFANLVNLLNKLWSVILKSKIMPEKPIRVANTD